MIAVEESMKKCCFCLGNSWRRDEARDQFPPVLAIRLAFITAQNP